MDPAVAAASFQLPDAMKLRRGMGKWILRKWLEKNQPAAQPFDTDSPDADGPHTGAHTRQGALVKPAGWRR